MKMKPLPWVLALLASAVCAQAQPPDAGQREGRSHHPRPMPPIIVALDADKDGKISAAEIEAAATALKTLDKNADGQLTREEIRPPRPPRPEGADEDRPERPKRPDGQPPKMSPPPIIGALDADKDGVISAVEIDGAPAALKSLDQNKDGELTRDELHPNRPDGQPAKMPPPPIIGALDADKNGVISAAEIDGAPAALKTLDQNKDGELTRDELRPAGGRPPREHGKKGGKAPFHGRPDGTPPEG